MLALEYLNPLDCEYGAALENNPSFDGHNHRRTEYLPDYMRDSEDV